MAVLTRREVDDDVRATLRLLSKVDFFPFFRSWFKWSKERFDPHSENLKINWFSSWWINLSFPFGKGGGLSIISEWPSYILHLYNLWISTARALPSSYVGFFLEPWALVKRKRDPSKKNRGGKRKTERAVYTTYHVSKARGKYSRPRRIHRCVFVFRLLSLSLLSSLSSIPFL